MSVAGSVAHLSPPVVGTPQELMDASRARWLSVQKRRLVTPTPGHPEYQMPLRMLRAPDWPGSGAVETATDVLPTVTIAGMPARAYPQYVRPLTGYTLAELVVSQPHMASEAWAPPMVRAALVTVATRAGVWAALGRAPEGSASVSGLAVRWSDQNSSLVVRPGAIGDGTEIWRSSLASSPGLPPISGEVATALCCVAPLNFLIGAALLLQSGEVYAMHYLERDVMAHLTSTLCPDAIRYLSLDQRATWDTMSAAAIGGYRASVTRALVTDPALIMSAHLRLMGSDQESVRARLAQIVASNQGVLWGFPSAPANATRPAPAPQMQTEASDDTVSVVDTEAGGAPGGSGGNTPRQPPPLDPATHADLLEAIRAVPHMPGGARSAARLVREDETVFW